MTLENQIRKYNESNMGKVVSGKIFETDAEILRESEAGEVEMTTNYVNMDDLEPGDLQIQVVYRVRVKE